MAAGDVGMTFTLEVGSSTVLVGADRTGSGVDDLDGRALDGRGALVDNDRGNAAQENNGTPSRGTTGAID